MDHDHKRHDVASGERHRDAIVALLGRVLPGPTVVLEVGAGHGSHTVHYARALPWLTWLPTDVDENRVDSIAAWRAEAGLPNVRAPQVLDVKSDPWDVPRFGAVFAVHVTCGSPWAVGVGMINGAARELPLHGALITIAEDGRWGDKGVDDAVALAAQRGLALDEQVEIAKGQVATVFRRR